METASTARRRARRRRARRRAPSRCRPRGRAARARSRSCARSRRGRGAARPTAPRSCPAGGRRDRRRDGGVVAAERQLDRDRRVHAMAAAAAQARVAQPLVHGGVEVEVADQQLLGEGRGAREHGCRRARRRRCGRRTRARPGRRRGCSRRRRRGRRARASRASPRATGPCRGGTGEAEMLSTQLAPSAAASATASGSQTSSQTVSASAPPGVSMCSEPRPGRERALLVEDAVVGQLALVVARQDLAVRDHERGVAHAVAVEPRAAHDERQLDLAASTLGLGLAGAQEGGPQQQVLGRIARDRELRREHELGARRAASAQASAMRFRFSASAPTVRSSWASARRSIDSTVAADWQRLPQQRHLRGGCLRAGERLVEPVGGLLLPVERRQARAPVARRATRRARGTRRAASRTGSGCARASTVLRRRSACLAGEIVPSFGVGAVRQANSVNQIGTLPP